MRHVACGKRVRLLAGLPDELLPLLLRLLLGLSTSAFVPGLRGRAGTIVLHGISSLPVACGHVFLKGDPQAL